MLPQKTNKYPIASDAFVAAAAGVDRFDGEFGNADLDDGFPSTLWTWMSVIRAGLVADLI
jgi:hypothetical protein